MDSRVEDFVAACHSLSNVTYGDDIMLTMGTDFTFSNAFVWYGTALPWKSHLRPMPSVWSCILLLGRSSRYCPCLCLVGYHTTQRARISCSQMPLSSRAPSSPALISPHPVYISRMYAECLACIQEACCK